MQPITLQGVITKFKGDGRKLGYPTANLTTETDLTDGVYFGYANLGQFHNHPALIFIGVPTTMGESQRRVEVHLLDIPDADYYNLTMDVTLMHYHRANQTFNNVKELLAVIDNDEQAARSWFAQNYMPT
jgi:FAD synthase